MLRGFDDSYAPAYVWYSRQARLGRAMAEYTSWKDGWELALRSRGWTPFLELPRRARKKLIPNRLRIREEAVGVYNEQRGSFVSFLTDEFCDCCAVELQKLRERHPTAITLVTMDRSVKPTAEGSLVDVLGPDELKWCRVLDAIVDYKGIPFELGKGEDALNGVFWPSTDQRVLELFSLRYPAET